MDSLKCKTTVKAIKSAMHNLPRGSEALETAYNEAINRIEAQPIDHQILAKKVISWITYAKRPLSIHELRLALAIEPGHPEFDEDNIPELDEMTTVCAGLIAVDEESDIVRLVHYTTQDYFGKIRLRWMPNGDADIASACLTCLSFDYFETRPNLSKPRDTNIISESTKRILLDLKHIAQSNAISQSYAAFRDYAVRYWGSHARETSDKVVEELALAFLADEPRVISTSAYEPRVISSSAYELRPPCSDYIGAEDSPKVSSVHLAAYHNLDKLFPIMLNHNHFPDTKDNDGRTPLSWAVIYEHEAMAKLLLELKEVQINSRDEERSTSLYLAARSGNESMMRILLEKKADVNLRNCRGETPLFAAAEGGHEAAVRLLLGKNTDVNLENRKGETPLFVAAQNGYETISRLLLEYNAKVDSENGYDVKLIREAIIYGRMAILRLLLEKKGNVNLKNSKGQTPLFIAIWFNSEAMVRLLLEHNAEVDTEDDKGKTPLHLVARRGYTDLIHLLLEHNAKMNAKDNGGNTPLHIAVEYCHTDLIQQLLLQRNAKVNVKNNKGYTPLFIAAKHGHMDSVQLLLEYDAEVNAKNNEGHTPLFIAADHGNVHVVKLLLHHNAYMNPADDEEGQTPLAIAIENKRRKESWPLKD